jgi:regulator of sigma E protease
MNFIFSFFEALFWFLIVLIPLIAVHEFGHLLMSRLCGVKISEYGIGMPLTKRLFYKRFKGIVWSFYPWLIGGFVRIYGDSDAIDEAIEKNKTDPQLAKQEYYQTRLQEIISNRELEFFLQDNNLEYNQQWQELENSKYIRGIEDKNEQAKVKHFNILLDQLKTLIDWEFAEKLKSKDTFFSKNLFQKTLILSGGVLFNMISAILILWMLFTIFPPFREAVSINDLPSFSQRVKVDSQSQYPFTGRVLKDSPADKVGLKPGDDLISIAGTNLQQIKTFEGFQSLIANNKNKEVEVIYKSRETGEVITKSVLLEEKQGRTLFGIDGLNYEVKYNAKDPINGLELSLERTAQITILNFTVLGDVLKATLPGVEDRSALQYVGGPVAISSISSKIFDLAGAGGILYMMAIISISLAVFNVLPVPVLDGGRWVLIAISTVLGRRNRKLELALVNGTFLILMLLSIIIAVSDVRGIFEGRF